MIDRALRITFRNFWTLFMIAAAFAFPLHLIHAYVFRNVIATKAFHDVIETYPRYRQVHSVGRDQIAHATATGWVIVAVELALLFFAVRAARRAIEVDEQGGVPTAPDSWRAAFGRSEGNVWSRRWAGPIVVMVAAAALVAVLMLMIGALVADFVGVLWAWTAIGMSQAIAVSTGVALLIGPLAIARSAKDLPPKQPTVTGTVRT